MRLRKFGEDASTRLLRLRKSYRSEILCIRSATGLKVCLYACFEGYMLVMLWCMLEACLWYL
jgi:hypothetical protein